MPTRMTWAASTKIRNRLARWWKVWQHGQRNEQKSIGTKSYRRGRPAMLSWSRPDPLTRDLVHLINARRHDHGDTDAAIDTLQAFLEQGREYDLLTVLAALDEDMAEWLFDLLAEASCSVLIDGPADDKLSYAIMAALELPLQANLTHPLKLKIDPVATADLLHRHLRLSAGTVVRVESRLLTDSTLEPLSLQGLNDHLSTVADSQRATSIAAR